MIEMLVLAMILSGVTLKAAGNAAVDVAFAVRGKESPRYTRAKARPSKSPSAFRRYWSQVWEDSWESQLQRHNRRVERRAARPEGPTFGDRWKRGRMVLRYAGWDAHNWMKRGWARLNEKRQSRSTRVPDAPDVVPGEVVPEPAVPAEPEPVPGAEPETGTAPQASTDTAEPADTPDRDQDRDSVKDCRNCHGDNRVDFGSLHHTRDQYCVLPGRAPQSHADSPDQPDQIRDDINLFTTPTIDSLRHRAENYFEQHPEERPLPHPTQEGTPVMTAMPTTPGDLVALDPMISYCDGSVIAHREQIIVIERAIAGLASGDDSSAAAGFLATAMDANSAALSAMESAAAELRKEKAIQEAYDAVQGAGTREFITGGR